MDLAAVIVFIGLGWLAVALPVAVVVGRTITAGQHEVDETDGDQ